MEMEVSLARPDTRHMVVICNSVSSHCFDLSGFDSSALVPREMEALPPFTDDPILYGCALYGALFPSDTLAHTTLLASPTRIVLVTDSDEVDAQPWEYAYSPDGFLVCISPFVRAQFPLQSMNLPGKWLEERR